MPEPRSERLRHPDTITGIAPKGGREHGLALPELLLHLGIGFEAATGEDDRAGMKRLAGININAHDAVRTVRQQTPRARFEPDLDTTLPHVVLDDFEEPRPRGRASNVRVRHIGREPRNVLDLREAKALVPRKRIVPFRGANLHPRRVNARELAQPVGRLDHSFGKPAEHGGRRRARIRSL